MSLKFNPFTGLFDFSGAAAVTPVVPGGSNTQIQFNDSNAFGGDTDFTWDKITKILTLAAGAYITSFGILNIQSGGDGNSLDLTSADGSSSNQAGGGISISAGGATLGNAGGGAINVYSGSAIGNGNAGNIQFTAADADLSGNGGNITFFSGYGGYSTGGNGGNIDLEAGSGQAGNTNGGNIILFAGDKNGSGVDGKIKLRTGHSGAYAVINTSLLASSDKTFTFPNTTGTFVVATPDVTITGDILQSSSSFLKSGGNLVIGGNGTNTLLRPTSSGGDIQIQSFAGSTNSTFTDGGRLGIATAAPDGRLHVSGAAGEDIHMYVGTAGSGKIVFDIHMDTTNKVGFLEAYESGVAARDIWIRGANIYLDGNQDFSPELTIGNAIVTVGEGTNFVLGATTGTKIGTATNQKLGFFNSTPVVKQTDGAGLTNNVTSGGSTDVIADFTSLTIYATDAAAIRNDIYQLARKIKIVDDALRTYGLLT